ncbi:enoyl-CoA hydratase/isomerase family protein [Novosphingobium sp. fls2-241-R2A-195]|jgi:2-(1,2-epoxy-1,2-dihydrophenyl)acetyl-CoA isomerase|uniref:enoyl-CoA hydratase/isomerase family protein n=1 Tax=Novosphingobium sp. fls2-241-R2A-195 TaxID=3040296 RepID=UPI00254EB50E|nr:enoyl-CoA hydratase/isomerase family protein [Novosphingobium sp. fls2-241-R2A-195]
MTRPAVLFDHADGIGVLTLDRPERRNALDLELIASLTRTLAEVSALESVRVLILAAKGRHFSVGGDLQAFAALCDEPPARRRAAMAELLEAAERMLTALVEMPIPVIAACRGTIAGGAVGLALAADLVVAEDSATFRFAQRDIGVPPDGGVSWLLPRVVGHRQAARLLLGAANVAGDEVLALGLVTHRAEAGEAETRALARDLAQAPPFAVRQAKALLARTATTGFAAQLGAERDGVLTAVEGEEFVARIRAFAASADHGAPT